MPCSSLPLAFTAIRLAREMLLPYTDRYMDMWGPAVTKGHAARCSNRGPSYWIETKLDSEVDPGRGEVGRYRVFLTVL